MSQDAGRDDSRRARGRSHGRCATEVKRDSGVRKTARRERSGGTEYWSTCGGRPADEMELELELVVEMGARWVSGG